MNAEISHMDISWQNEQLENTVISIELHFSVPNILQSLFGFPSYDQNYPCLGAQLTDSTFLNGLAFFSPEPVNGLIKLNSSLSSFFPLLISNSFN